MKRIALKLQTMAISTMLLSSNSQAMQLSQVNLPTIEQIIAERKEIDDLSAVKPGFNPGENQRFPINNQFIISPTLKLIERMRADSDYIPTAEERKILYICNSVFTEIDSMPQKLIKKNLKGYENLEFLAENENISYDRATKSLKLNDKNLKPGGKKNIQNDWISNWIIMQKSDIEWAISHIDDLVNKNNVKIKPLLIPESNIKSENIQLEVDVAQEQVVAEWKKWNNKLASWVNVYFKEPYEDQLKYSVSRVIDGKTYKVPRPNHALAHGMRTGFI